MKKILLFGLLILLIIGLGGIFVLFKLTRLTGISDSDLTNGLDQNQQIDRILEQRLEQNFNGDDTDPFDDDNLVKILFIGLDNRVGQTAGHCDAIQFIEIDKNKATIKITAVPRGTYAPLPGSGHQPTDYYVAKSCEVGGLDYGVKQIEKILSQKADYVVFLGFSEALGIFRQLDLPANETMQWLRHRQGYAIGEPQRARNHSNFLKQMLIKYTPQLDSKFSLPVQYLGYKLLRTDLSFTQARIIAEEIVKIDPTNNPDKIKLSMRPAYAVSDIEFNPENINEQLDKLIKPIASYIPEGAYTGIEKDEAQQKLSDNIKAGLADPDFVRWAYDNYLWFQIDDEDQRELAHYDLLVEYIALLKNPDEQNNIITDYIIEMENLGQDSWAQKGKDLLAIKI